MFYQKTWDGILVTQVEVPCVVWGEILWALMQINPVYQLAECARGLLLLGDPGPHLLGLLGSTALFLVPCTLLSVRLTRRRVLGD